MCFWSNSVKLCGLVLIVGLAILSGLSEATVQAQADPTNTPAEAQIVEVTTADGMTLMADYWALSPDQTPSTGAPAVVVMHAYYATRQAGVPLVGPLLRAGYNVLFSDWRVADSLDDIQIWLDWLRDQPNVRPGAISTLGSGVGGTGAIISCANDAQCVTAIAVSPALVDPRLPTALGDLAKSALSDGLSARSALLIASQQDPYSDAKDMIPFAMGEIGLRLYPGSDAREGLFTGSRHADSVIQLITSWLNEHTPAAV